MLNSKLIGDKIATSRKKANLSQAELAQQVSISPQAVGKWERGESMPDITTLNRLAEILGVDLNYFSDNLHSIKKEIEVKDDRSKNEDGVFSKLKDNLGLDWNMSGENYIESDFSGIKNIKNKLSGSSFKKCKLIESDLSEITFRGNSIKECDFLRADLRNSRFYGTEIRANSFEQASFIDTVIEASEIRNCNLASANLSGLEVKTSEFKNNTVENVIWKHVSLKDTQITEITFSGLFEDSTFEGCKFSKTTFNKAIFKNCFFKYCDLKRVDFKDCQTDKLTYEFLKNCKAKLIDVKIL